MPTVRLPAAHLDYACERSLVCCREPVRAPCSPEEEARIATRLASSEAGRGYLPILHAGFADLGGVRVFAQREDLRCVHLAETGPPYSPEASCSLHLLGGLDALSLACRNYPRGVARLPEEEGSEAALEVLFLLACPTAAKLLVRDRRPFRFVEVPLEGWPYPPLADASRETMEEIRALRAGWWRVLGDGRGETRRVAAVLGAMLTRPYDPADPDRASALDSQLLGPYRSIDVEHVLSALEDLPERGQHYGLVRWEARRKMLEETTEAALFDALDIAPELLVAFLEHQLPWARVHDPRPFHAWLQTMVRRTVIAARLADALLARIPFAIDTLFADLFMASIHLDARASPPAP